jgi:hypothetical protein
MEPKNFTDFTAILNCELCDVKCSRPSEMKRHLLTLKHKRKEVGKNLEGNFTTEKIYQCNCGKNYKTHSGLWKHKKSCIPQNLNEPSANEVKFLTNLVMEIVKNNTELQKQTKEIYKQNTELQKQNHELQNKVIDVCKNSNSTYNSHNNSNNKTFNMQFFLNETCKDAMNIMDFVNSMTLEFSDLEDVGKLGYVEGISNIIIRKLNALDIHKRPIHCSDAKREIMFVKDENIWEKENSTYDKLRKAIKHITCKNSAMLDPWSKENPQCMNTSHRLNDVYVQMISQSMGGKESFLESENKIMKKIAKAVLIEK